MYGSLRAQALTTAETLSLIEKLLGEKERRPGLVQEQLHSAGDGVECVEVAAGNGGVYVRDSKDKAGPVDPILRRAAWAEFIGFARRARPRAKKHPQWPREP
ncbi:hypothetical protein GCM10023238_15810 [Streptomyces heliomycini]